MSQKISITNFGAITKLDIELKKVLVLIGEQASGKSTIAKLIYFFKSLADEFFAQYYASPSEAIILQRDLITPVCNKFYDFFGATQHFNNFNIRYEYAEKRSIILSLDDKQQLQLTISDNFFTDAFEQNLIVTKRQLRDIEQQIQANNFDIRTKMALEQEKIQALQTLSRLIDTHFGNEHSHSLYAVAGRESTVSYETTFEAYLEKTLNEWLTANRKNTLRAKQQSIDESLTMQFLQEIRRIKSVFQKYGGSFNRLFEHFDNDNATTHQLQQHIKAILKANYAIDEQGEKLVFDNGQYVYLKDASSGQKEAVRLLQDVALAMVEQQKVLRVVEEPEAHLFPVAQKQLIEVLMGLKNYNDHNQFIITTHSPYILTVFNNLLFASRVIAANPAHKAAVDERFPELFRIHAKDFAAYSLGNSMMPDAPYCVDIVNSQTGLIHQNYLDTVSQILGQDFNYLYALHAKTIQQQR